jgi:hypothetical protein
MISRSTYAEGSVAPRQSCGARALDVQADHVKAWQTVGKLRRQRGVVTSGEPGYRVEGWTRDARPESNYMGQALQLPLVWAIRLLGLVLHGLAA